MPRLVLMEGNTAATRARAASINVRCPSQIYSEAILRHYPDMDLDVLNGADDDWAFPEGRGWADYDGLVIAGSALHAYDQDFAVTNQIAMVADAGKTGLPIFGSCWGLQISVMAAGGVVEYSPRGREVGLARKILPNVASREHPIFKYKRPVFDAPCIHYDEVTRLPENAELLASNSHSEVQAALVPVGESTVWAVQYHPEFDLKQLYQLFRFYADDMIDGGFFNNRQEYDEYLEKLERLIENPADMGLGWQLGIDEDILDDRQRNGEIIAWIEHEVLKQY